MRYRVIGNTIKNKGEYHKIPLGSIVEGDPTTACWYSSEPMYIPRCYLIDGNPQEYWAIYLHDLEPVVDEIQVEPTPEMSPWDHLVQIAKGR